MAYSAGESKSFHIQLETLSSRCVVSSPYLFFCLAVLRSLLSLDLVMERNDEQRTETLGVVVIQGHPTCASVYRKSAVIPTREVVATIGPL
jgi:hypothetical protein